MRGLNTENVLDRPDGHLLYDHFKTVTIPCTQLKPCSGSLTRKGR